MMFFNHNLRSDIAKSLPSSIHQEYCYFLPLNPICIIETFRNYKSSISHYTHLNSGCLNSVFPIADPQVTREENTNSQAMKFVLVVVFTYKLYSIRISVLALSHTHEPPNFVFNIQPLDKHALFIDKTRAK